MAVFKKQNVWWIDYTVNGNRKREKIGTDKRLAESILAKRKCQIKEGTYFDIERSEKISFRDFATTYLETHAKTNKKSWDMDGYRLKAINAVFGDKLLSSIKSIDIEGYKSERLKTVSPASVNRELALIKVIFSKAIEWGKYHKTSPAVKVKKLREDNHRLRYLSKEEIQSLYDNCSGDLLGVVKFAVNTGMRKEEIMSLTWTDVDVEKKLIYLRDSKSGKARTLPMNKTVREVLLSTKKGETGSKIFNLNLRDHFNAAIEKAKIADATFHTLRHTFASWFMMLGGDLLTLSRLLGHSSIAMTQRYSHLAPDFMASSVQRLDTLMTPAPVSVLVHNPELVRNPK